MSLYRKATRQELAAQKAAGAKVEDKRPTVVPLKRTAKAVKRRTK